MNVSDVIVILVLFLFTPLLVKKHVGGLDFGRKIKILIIFGGMLWILLSLGHGLVHSFLGTGDSDAIVFETQGYENARYLEQGNYKYILNELSDPGRGFFSAWLGLIYHFTGGTKSSTLALNAFLAFWGGLILTRLVYTCSFERRSENTCLPLFLIFTPSVVFWSSTNLKEGLMYWAICLMVSFVKPAKSHRELNIGFVIFCIGAFVGVFIRPHVAIIWIIGVLAGKIGQSGFWKFAIIILLVTPLIILPIKKRARSNLGSLEQTIRFAEMRMNILISRQKASTFDFGEKGPVPVLSGAISSCFRPFIWQYRNLRSFLAALEIWFISLGIVWCWARMNKSEWKRNLCNPAVRTALIVLLPFWLLFSYFPNEGLIARQRIQMFPALLVLLGTPILQKPFFRLPQNKVGGT
jgi:hypothetical protein